MGIAGLIILSLIVAAILVWLSNGISQIILQSRIPSGNQKSSQRAKIDKLLSENRKRHKTEAPQNDQELTILNNALLFSKVRIRDCMIPRTEIEAIEINSGIAEVLKKCVATGYSKIVVYQKTIDNVVGYISSKELFKHPKTIKEKLNTVTFVPETMPANKLLHEFMQHHRSMAVVVDEYGGTSGIVTLEDIMEEIFGEIEDEHDTDDLVERQVKPQEYIFSCRLEIEYLNSKYGLHLPENEDYDTLAGYILYHYHNLPKPKDVVEIFPYSFRILKVSHTRIELVYLKVAE
jgi:CBS domain containing-hemolysin-like protein